MGHAVHFAGAAATERRWIVAFVCAGLTVCALSVYVGIASPLRSFPGDTFVLLDNAYRVTLGQVPYRDFSAALGPVLFLMDAAGLYLANMDPAGLGYANAIFGGAIAMAAFIVAWPRWSAAAACAIGLYTVLLLTAPFALSYHPLSYSYAMLYNRYGYALIGLIVVECAATLLPRAGVSSRQNMGGAIATGIAVGLLAFLKVSFALASLPFIAISVLTHGGVRRATLIAAGGLFVGLTMAGYLRFDIMPMLQDLRIAAAARGRALEPWHGLGLLDSIQILLIVVFAAAVVTSARTWLERVRWGAFSAAILATGYGLLITNQQQAGFPLNGFFAIILACAARGSPSRLLRWPGVRPQFPAAFLLFMCVVPLALSNAVSLVAASVERTWPLRPHVPWPDAPDRAKSLQFDPLTGYHLALAGTGFVAPLIDGVDLLRRRTTDQDGVLVFDFVNPFNYLLNRPPPRGGFAAASYNNNFSEIAYPPADRILGDARYLMVRKYDPHAPDAVGNNIPTVAALAGLYGDAVRRDFVPVEETAHWQLWRRR